MILYARHSAWLAAPIKIGKSQKPRRDVIPGDAKAHTMPPLLGFDYLAAAWSECGAYSIGMNGVIGLSWQEIDAYNRAASARLCGHECRIIYAMSRAYCNEYHSAGKSTALQPYVSDAVDVTESESDRIRNQLRAIKP